MLRAAIATAINDVQHSTADYVKSLAAENDIAYAHSPMDDLAQNINRLMGDDVSPPDETLKLLIALTRHGVITGEENMALTAQHLRETR